MENLFKRRLRSVIWLWQSRKHRISSFSGFWALCASCVFLNIIRKQAGDWLTVGDDEDGERPWCCLARTLLTSTLSILIGVFMLGYFAHFNQRRKHRQTALSNNSAMQKGQHTHPEAFVSTHMKTTNRNVPQITHTDEVEAATLPVTTANVGVMTSRSLSGSDKAVNTSHRPHSIARAVGTFSNGTAKRKIRRAQKSLEEVLEQIQTERWAKMKEWRSSLMKFRNKMLQLIRTTQDKNKLVGYVITSRRASQKDVENTAIYVRSLKEKLNQQFQQNEKQYSTLKTKTSILKTMNHFVGTTLNVNIDKNLYETRDGLTL